MKNRQNTVSKEIPKLKKAGEDASEIMAEMKKLSAEIKDLDGQLSEIEDNLRTALLNVPNTPYKDVQYGEDDSANVELRKVGEPTEFDFEPKAHWDIGEDLGILDFERAAKISGARFTVYKGYPVHARPSHHRSGLRGDPAAVHGKPRGNDRNRTAS